MKEVGQVQRLEAERESRSVRHTLPNHFTYEVFSKCINLSG